VFMDFSASVVLMRTDTASSYRKVVAVILIVTFVLQVARNCKENAKAQLRELRLLSLPYKQRLSVTLSHLLISELAD
jgi:hypothetical protein